MSARKQYYISDAIPTDYEDIYALFNAPNCKYFGFGLSKYENSHSFFAPYVTHRLLVYETRNHKNPIAYAEISNYPNIPALLEECWPEWLKYHYW